MRILFERLVGLDGTPRKLLLGNDFIARRVSVLNRWNKIRVGIRFVMQDAGGSIAGTPKLWLGMGTWLKGIGNYNAHFVGVRSNTATPSRSTSGGIAVYGPSFTAVTMVGQTETTSGAASRNICATPELRRSILFCDIDKTNPAAVAVSIYGSTNAVTGIYDWTYEMFIDAMEQESPAGTSFTQSSLTTTLTVDEAANGPLDSVNLAWSRTLIPIELSDVVVGYYDAFD
jgi:hypothetical protein